MPLFRSSNQPQAKSPSSQETSPSRSRSIFSRRNSPSTNNTSASSSPSGNGFFGRRSPSSRNGSGAGHLKNDPTILAARKKVADAESFEHHADNALLRARAAVKEARQHVKILEREALDEARRAKAKQAEAMTVSKSAKHLGRHG